MQTINHFNSKTIKLWFDKENYIYGLGFINHSLVDVILLHSKVCDKKYYGEKEHYFGNLKIQLQ